MLRRATLQRILRKVAAQPDGIARSEVFRLHRIQTADFWNGIRDQKYPLGLRGLISEEKCPANEPPEALYGSNNHPIRRWLVTAAGTEFLEKVIRNPRAMPPKDIQPERRLISDDAREFAREERLKKAKHQRHSEKHARFMRHPKHSGAQYDELPSDPNILIGSPEFRRLSVLERIRLVREQYGGTGKSYREPPESEPKQEKSTAEFIEEIRNMKPWMQPSFPQYSVSSPPMPLEPESLTLPYPESELSSDPYIRQFQEAENQKWRIRNGMK